VEIQFIHLPVQVHGQEHLNLGEYMAHFAQVKSGIVQQVIVADQNFINTLSDASDWVQTSYNMIGGVNKTGLGSSLRKNYAGIGHTYDSVKDAFYAPKPYPSWTLDTDTCLWNAPTPMPNDGHMYNWDESTLSWVEQS